MKELVSRPRHEPLFGEGSLLQNPQSLDAEAQP